MASMTITIPDAVAQRVTAALCANAHRSPATPANAKAAVIDLIKGITKNHEAAQAGLVAQTTAAQQADTDIVLT
jgi:hypothetical protein